MKLIQLKAVENLTAKSQPRYTYQAIDDEGNIIASRKSNNVYTVAFVDGKSISNCIGDPKRALNEIRKGRKPDYVAATDIVREALKNFI